MDQYSTFHPAALYRLRRVSSGWYNPAIDMSKTAVSFRFHRLLRLVDAAAAHRATPAIVAGCFAAALVFVGLRFHTAGDLRYDSDFFDAYVHEAKSFLGGHVEVAAYKGPVYPIALGTLHLLLGWITGGMFETGIILSALSAGVFLFATYILTRALFSPRVALAAVALIVVNPTFVRCSYTTGNDMFFCAIAMAAAWALLRPSRPRARWMLAAGVLSALAFLTRYNGVFLVVGGTLALVLLDPWKRPLARRAGSAALFLAGFVVILSPWLAYSKHETGHLLVNENYMNVAYAFYMEDELADAFRARHEGAFHSFGDVVRYDPARFFGELPDRAGELVFGTLGRVVLWPVSAAVVMSLFLLRVRRPGRRRLAYYGLAALFMGTLVPVFFAERFTLFAIPAFATLAACGLSKLGRKRVAAATAAMLILYSGVVCVGQNVGYLRPYFDGFRAVAEAFKDNVPPGQRGSVVAARRGYFGYFAGLETIAVPTARTYADLIAYLRQNDADYLFFSFYAADTRPELASLSNPDSPHPGLRTIMSTSRGTDQTGRTVPYAVLYQVERAPSQ